MSVTINGSGQIIVQVQSVVKTDTFSYATTTLTDITGLSVSITPTSAANKILVMCHIGVGGDYWNSAGVTLNLVRGSTNILAASTNGNSAFFNAFSSSQGNTNFNGTVLPIMYLDSPATTSAITYKLQAANPTGSFTCYINRTTQDQTNSRSTSTITVMEISG